MSEQYMMKELKKRDENFIESMLSETYLELVGGEEKSLNAAQLEDYFESKNRKWELEKFTHFYRLNIDGNLIDFPNNWSVFSEIERKRKIEINSANDDDLILELIKNLGYKADYVSIDYENEKAWFCIQYKKLDKIAA